MYLIQGVGVDYRVFDSCELQLLGGLVSHCRLPDARRPADD